MQSASSIGARSIDIESGRAIPSAQQDLGCCAATCVALAYSIRGAVAGAASGALTGCIVKLGQLTANSAGADLEHLPLKDLVIASTVIGTIFGAGGGLAKLIQQVKRS